MVLVWVGTDQWRCNRLMKHRTGGHFGQTKGNSPTVSLLWKHCAALKSSWLQTVTHRMTDVSYQRSVGFLTSTDRAEDAFRQTDGSPWFMRSSDSGALTFSLVCSKCHSGYFKCCCFFFFLWNFYIFLGLDADKLLWRPLSGKLAASLHIVIWAYRGGAG